MMSIMHCSSELPQVCRDNLLLEFRMNFCRPAGTTTITIIIITHLGQLSTVKWWNMPGGRPFLCMSQLLGPWTFLRFPKSMHFYWGFLRLHSHLYCLGLAQQSQEAVMTRVTHLEIFDQQCNKVSLNQLFWQDDFDETGNMKLHGVVYPRRWAT